MRLRNNAAILTVITVAAGSATAFIPSDGSLSFNTGSASLSSGSGLSRAVAATIDESSSSTETESSTAEPLDMDGIKKMTFRQLQKSCVDRGLPAVGNTAALRARLLESAGLPVPGSAAAGSASSRDGPDENPPDDIDFSDESDPEFEFKSLVKETNEKAS
eukprot:CAMPEP_0178594320 /NCGR_PEP_ID=MMETSP0697-20121206/30438_1 /TAXON_ID=265572 /ORGANISM="Extubocellulus spinifer, Strain CCMP396" /LENGTH=160 /DNA_ID=CAMNT_0020231597 /DNA_START=13 /DNA_END=493 /DNA_ORIENTATION=+